MNNLYTSEFKMYAENGLRTVEDWSSLGRKVASDAKPRAEAPHRGVPLSLFSRDQTLHQPAARRSVAVAVVPTI